MKRPTPSEIEAAKTVRGGWTKKQLAEWGVPWPPPRGWRERLERGQDRATVIFQSRVFTREQTMWMLMREHNLTKFQAQAMTRAFETQVELRKRARGLEEGRPSAHVPIQDSAS